MEGHGRDDDATPPGRQSINPNVFDDEFAVDNDDLDFGLGVADGFRPGRQLGATSDDQRVQSASARQSAIQTPEPGVRRMASRNSTAKPPQTQNSFAVANDGASPALPARTAVHARAGSSHATALLHRSSVSSNSSFATMARSESPYGVGPSHPYGMYPQNTTVNRSSSVTTSSTVRQPARSFSTQRPTHPYGMYVQNASEDRDEEHITPAPIIPVGFPGLDTGYHRQIGPDGEEQDIIGPDGHTEQLPPYTRYPEEGPSKHSLAAEPSRSPVATVPPRVETSQDALVSPSTPSDQHARAEPTVLPMSESSGTSHNAESGVTEKSWKNKSWQDIRRRRVLWGKIPLWVLLLFMALVLVFAVILGAAIGSFAAREKMQSKKPPPESIVTVITTASMFDASLIPTPSNLSPLPMGTFTLPISIPQERSSNCLTLASQDPAWSCTFPGPSLQLSVDPDPDGGLPYASIQPMDDDDDDNHVEYGVQPPTLEMESLSLVTDQDFPKYGPAFHFQALYDKKVILKANDFSATAGLRPRDKDFHHRLQVQPGEKPWVCYWNSTFIEGYIYVTNNSSAASLTTSTCTTTTAATTSLPATDTESSPPPPTSPPVSSSPTPTPSWTDPFPSMSNFMSYSTSLPFRPRGDGDEPHFLPYPRIVKVEERRLPGSPQPVCQQMQLLDSRELAPAYDEAGNPIIVILQETDPSMSQFSQAAASASGAAGKRKRDDPPDACHCQWMFQ